MFKGLGNFAGLLKNMGNMSSKMEEIGERLKNLRIRGSAGGDLVVFEGNGLGQILQVQIDDSLRAEPDWELIQDLLVAAANDLQQKAKQAHVESMQEITGGMDLPGMGDLFNKMGLGN